MLPVDIADSIETSRYSNLEVTRDGRRGALPGPW